MSGNGGQGLSSIGIQCVAPTTPRRTAKPKAEDDRDTDDAQTEHEYASPPTPGTGRLVDKTA